MRLLLDTCAVIFFAENTGDLSPATMSVIAASNSEVFVTVISIAEIACAQEHGKLKIKLHWRLWWQETLRRNAWACLAITPEIMAEAFSLPLPIHRDPADRLIIATARVEHLTVVTTDRKIREYPHVPTIA